MMSVAMVTPGTLQEVYIQDLHRYLINPQILSSVRKLRDTSSVGFDKHYLPGIWATMLERDS